MESIIRDVRDLVPGERHAVETLIGHDLTEDQRILVMVLPMETEPSDSVRLRAREDFLLLSKLGSENRERLEHICMEGCRFDSRRRVTDSNRTGTVN